MGFIGFIGRGLRCLWRLLLIRLMNPVTESLRCSRDYCYFVLLTENPIHTVKSIQSSLFHKRVRDKHFLTLKLPPLQPMAKWDTGRIRAQLTSLKLLYSGPYIHLQYCLHERNWSTKTKQWISRSVSSVLLAEAWAIDSFPSTNINLACGDARSLDLWTSSNLLHLVHGQVPLSG